MSPKKYYPTLWYVLAGLSLLLGIVGYVNASAQQPDPKETIRREIMARQQADAQLTNVLEAQAATPCVNGFAGAYPCLNTDLMAFMPLATFSAGSTNDVQGWTDPLDGKEYAVLGLNNGTAFIDITDPENPVYLGKLPGHNGSSSTWRELDVLGNYAYVVSEAGGHGLQIFDLTQLRTVVNPPVTFTETAHYNGFGSAHTVGSNAATNFVYAMGSNTCAGGLHMVNVANPLSPLNAGCYSADGYSHDAQCILYNGPDTDYQGQEICFNSNEDTLTIVDVTNKASPVTISINPYAGAGYTHQTWITDDHTYVLLEDELDEINFGHQERIRIWDVSDLDAPVIIGVHDGPNNSIDHNIYIHEGYGYLAAYTSGLQIFDLADVANGNLTLVAHFDSYTPNDAASFNGAWAVFPYFESGSVLITGIGQGMYIVRPELPSSLTLAAEPETFSFCGPGSEQGTVTLLSEVGYTGNVTLSTPDLPAGSASSFETNPLTAPNSTPMTITVNSTGPGIYPFTLHAGDGVYETNLPLTLEVFESLPNPTTLVSPADGEEDVPFVPTLSWDAVPNAHAYTVQIASDEAFTSLVYTAEVTSTAHTITTALDALTTYYWRVAAQNACGESAFSEVASFTTEFVPTILLVDDDNNDPDVRSYYTAALDSLGLSYDLWDTANSDNEPQTYHLSAYKLVVWFTGDESNGAAGPGAEAETMLASWLDTQTACLFLSSQNFYNDRGLTTFMQTYLGVSSIEADSGNYTEVNGASVFSGLGPYSLFYPFPDYSDRLYADGTAEIAFVGTNARNAALYKDAGTYQTAFLAFPLEAIYGAGNRKAVLQSFIEACNLPTASLTPAASTQTGLPGTSVVHTFQVINLGAATDTFSVTLSGQGWTTTAPASLGPLAPGTATTLEITVDIPQVETIVASDTFTVTLASTSHPGGENAQATGITYANVTPNVAVSTPVNGSGSPGTEVAYSITLTNTGNYTDTFLLAVSGVWGAEPSVPAIGPLGPGESTSFQVVVLIPSDALIGTSETTTITVTSGLDMDVTATVQIQTLTGLYRTFLPVMAR